MIIKHFTKEGYINSYFEWDVVNILGQQDKHGTYMHVRDIWVHPSLDGREEIKEFIRELDDDKINKTVEWIYWRRDDIRPSKLFSRANCLRKAGRYATVLEKVFK